MNIRLCWAILASFVLHGIIVALWPGISPSQITEPASIVWVSLFEEASFVETEKKGSEVKPDASEISPADKNRIFDKAVQSSKRITESIIEGIESRHWDRPKYNEALSNIELPKQIVRPDSTECVEIWPEELTDPKYMDTESYPAPKVINGHKHPPKAINIASMTAPLFQEEFPEEKVSLKAPDITWKGEPRKWINKPDSAPTYQADEEGIVKLRFWVDEHGEVVNAIPIRKLSAELEEKALVYIFSWRFESSPGRKSQEGVIRINFRLEQPVI